MRDRRASRQQAPRADALRSARLRGGSSRLFRVCRQYERVSQLRGFPCHANNKRSTKTDCPCVGIPCPVRDCSWRQSFPRCLRNSETLKPLALAFALNFRYSAPEILSCTNFDRRSAFGFGGRPMRFFISYPHNTLCNYNKSSSLLPNVLVDTEGRKQQLAPLAPGERVLPGM